MALFLPMTLIKQMYHGQVHALRILVCHLVPCRYELLVSRNDFHLGAILSMTLMGHGQGHGLRILVWPDRPQLAENVGNLYKEAENKDMRWKKLKVLEKRNDIGTGIIKQLQTHFLNRLIVKQFFADMCDIEE